MFENIQRLNTVKEKIIIFGAGIVGKVILNICQQNNISIYGFCDNLVSEGSIVEGLMTYRLETLYKRKEDFVFIITIRDIDSIVKQLDNYSFEKWLPAHSFYNLSKIDYKNYVDFKNIEMTWYLHKNYCCKNEMNANTIDLVITEKCSLRCKECSNLMQYYTEPQNFELEQIKKEIDRLTTVYDEIYELRLLGGEPFMNQDIGEIIKYINDKKNILGVCVYTNGTILPNKEQIEIIKKGNVWFSISNYGTLSLNLNKMIILLEKNNINYDCKTIEYWVKCSSFSKQNRNEAELERVYQECCAKNLLTLLKGKLYICPFIANAMNLRSIPLNRNDYVDIMREDSINAIKQDIKNLVQFKKWYFSCDFCEGRPDILFLKEENKILPYEQVQKPLSYVKIE